MNLRGELGSEAEPSEVLVESISLFKNIFKIRHLRLIKTPFLKKFPDLLYDDKSRVFGSHEDRRGGSVVGRSK